MINSKPKLACFILTVFIIIFIVGCDQMDVSNYKGDGKIMSVGGLFRSGYKIEFEGLSLKKTFSAQYEIVKLPKIKKTFWCGLIIRTNDSTDALPDGVLELTLTSPKNGVIFSCTGPLKEWKMSIEKTGGDVDQNEYYFYYLKNDETTSFKYEDVKNEDLLILKVDYYPQSSPSKLDEDGIIQIRVGGFL